MSDTERFQELRHRQLSGETLPDTEQAALNAYLAAQDAAEVNTLTPGWQRMTADTMAREERNRRLAELVAKREKVAARLHTVLEETRREDEAIVQEFRALMASTAA